MTYVGPLALIVIGAAIGWAGRAIMLRMRIKALQPALRGTKPADRPEIIRALLGEQPSHVAPPPQPVRLAGDTGGSSVHLRPHPTGIGGTLGGLGVVELLCGRGHDTLRPMGDPMPYTTDQGTWQGGTQQITVWYQDFECTTCGWTGNLHVPQRRRPTDSGQG
jgi:hypothetical protein